MTNGDRIRAMTDEELAERLDENIACYKCWLENECHGKSCKEMFMEWLRSPAESEGKP